MHEPQNDADGKRKLTMRFRVTADERKDLLARAAGSGMTYSDYVRSRLLGSKQQTKKATPLREAIIRLMAELGKSGSNLNQISRSLNRMSDEREDYTDTIKMVEHIANEHRAILEQLNRILEEHGHQG